MLETDKENKRATKKAHAAWRHRVFAERTGVNPDREQFYIGIAIVVASIVPLALVLVW